ncbi:hypothetical protein Mycsm_06522 (plasmid) [Mycobacterium sp. JS623]|nr:hypothetical protein Mycsm_06522 [Mycobacterium sp. JS623]
MVSYLGWHGRGNLGDDAIYDVVQTQLCGAVFVDIPHHPHEQLFASATGLDHWARGSSLVIGGGTLAGRRYFRRLLDRGIETIGDGDCFAVGIGVEDPVFQGFKSGSEDDELRRWRPLLSRFDTVSVRGPRSAELLADIGLEVEVSGDPALLLPQPEIESENGLIGVNLGFGDDLWGHDPERLVTEVGGAVRELVSRGHRIVGILMHEDDRDRTERALGGVAARIVQPEDAVSAVAELARCSAVVVSRLHAGILAALAETPVISLEYQPKCRDFARSVDDERSLIRTDSLTAGAVVERVSDALENADTIKRTVGAAVKMYRERLAADYAKVRSSIGLPII